MVAKDTTTRYPRSDRPLRFNYLLKFDPPVGWHCLPMVSSKRLWVSDWLCSSLGSLHLPPGPGEREVYFSYSLNPAKMLFTLLMEP